MYGSHTENPKETLYVEQIRRNHKKIEQIQDEKLVLSKKAVDLVSLFFLTEDPDLYPINRTPISEPSLTICFF